MVDLIYLFGMGELVTIIVILILIIALVGRYVFEWFKQGYRDSRSK